MKIVGGWNAEELSQKGKEDWKQLVLSLRMKQTQKEIALAILDRFTTHGYQYGDRGLSFEERSHKKWTSAFLPVKEVRKLNSELVERGTCKRRYFWDILNWLEQTGWVKETQSLVDGHWNKGWALDSSVYRWLVNAERRVPRLWEEAERGWRSRADRVASSKGGRKH